MRICGLWWFYCSHSGGWMPLSCGGEHWWGRWGQVGRPSIEAGPSRDNGIVTMLICTQPPVTSSCWPTHNQGHHLPLLMQPSTHRLSFISVSEVTFPCSQISFLGPVPSLQWPRETSRSLCFLSAFRTLNPCIGCPLSRLWSISINCTWTCNISHHCHRGFS